MKKEVMFLIRFLRNSDGFEGWNSVYAKNLKEAKNKLLKKCGKEMFQKINWESLTKGKKAELLDAKLEKECRSLFD